MTNSLLAQTTGSVQMNSDAGSNVAIKRVKALVRFASAITIVNILGHVWLGFEQSWATPFVAVGAAYVTELLAEGVSACSEHRPPKFLRSFKDTVVFLLPAHISGLAVGMLLYPAAQLWTIAFAASAAVASKWLIRARLRMVDGRLVTIHVLNPSNFGIAVTLSLFPTVGLAPPYHFTENTSGLLDWLLPLIVITTGSLLNTKLTGRMPLILSWFAAFALQALLRSSIHSSPLWSGLMPMSSFPFMLFSFYMITDPATTPSETRGQVAFAVSVAAFYALFMELHIVFGLFYSLSLVCLFRGLFLMYTAPRSSAQSEGLILQTASK